MIQFVLVFSAYVIILNVIKTENNHFISIRGKDYLVCDEIICL